MELHPLYEKLEKLFGKWRGFAITLAFGVCFGLAEHIGPWITHRVDTPWTPIVADTVSLCEPSNLEELKQKHIEVCPHRDGKVIAMPELLPGTELVYRAAPKQFFSSFRLDGVIPLNKAGGGVSITITDSEGNELKIENAFEAVDFGKDGSLPPGTGIPLFWQIPTRGTAQLLGPMQNTEEFTGYRTFSYPDYERFSIRADATGVSLDYNLIEAWAEHRTPDDLDKQAAILFHRQMPSHLSKMLVSVRIRPTLPKGNAVRLDSLERGGETLPARNVQTIRGCVVLPHGLSPEDVVVHAEPYGSKGNARDAGAVRPGPDACFSLTDLPVGAMEVWAEIRTEDGELFTGNCAFDPQDSRDPWRSHPPQTNVPRAQRSSPDVCRRGDIALESSPERDKFAPHKKKHPAAKHR
jgi:hypothetical protein